MGVSLSLHGYASKDSPEFVKHSKAVLFCIEHKLSYPKETSEFFKGKIDGGDLEDYDQRYLFDKIKDGIEVELPIQRDKNWSEIRINVKDIPAGTDVIIARLS